MAMALLGYSDHKTNSHDGARYKTRCALILALVAIVFGSICIVLLAVLPVYAPDAVSSLKEKLGGVLE